MTTRSTRRAGYTIIELLVSMALIMTIMAILSMAFVEGLKTFGSLRATADMSQKLRTATTTIRNDLSNFHFDGAIRPSDPGFGSTVLPREGFIRIYQGGASVSEGTDGLNPSYLANPNLCPATGQILHLSVKLRGNRPEDFFACYLPGPLGAAGSLGASTTFFNQPGDARNQTLDMVYYSQWAEVMYYLVPTGAATSPLGGASQPLYGLYRAQRLLVANTLNLPAGGGAGFASVMSINPGNSNFNTPADLTTVANRSLNPTALPGADISTLVASNVVSFTVRPIMQPPTAGQGQGGGGMPIAFDTNYDSATANPNALLYGVEISIRLWDLKSSQTRQITIIQDL
jgi:Prokaryotic N-terminal methylation motif